MPSNLLDQLNTRYDETPAARVMSPAGQAHWVGSFGRVMRNVRSIVAHLTAGWPRRDIADNFVNRYIVPGTASRGIGPQFYISRDGTVSRFVDLPRRTGHAEFVNAWSLGVETGNLGDVAPPPSRHWLQASAETEDIPGAKLWITSGRPVQTEVMPCWWTTGTFNGPSRGPIGANWMLFSEFAYHAWADLAKYLMEEYRLPRNFPLLPHQLRSSILRASAPFRSMVLADERAEMMMRAFANAPINIQAVNFEEANAAAFQTEYEAAIANASGNLKRHNRAWRSFFNVYRGLHGHGFSGAIFAGHHDHDCPGPLFDFHRLAREVWDWWWYPFDVNSAGNTDAERRGYRQWTSTTPLLEYYFDESEVTRSERLFPGIHGTSSSPATFSLTPRSPIYAMANGELVAARFPPPEAGVSLAFLLVRHPIFHLPLLAAPGLPPPQPEAINYDRAPSYVYSLSMHLGRPENMTFEQVHEDNPDWLNRLLIRKKEYDLGIAFYDDDPNHHGIANAVWNNRPPGIPQRPTTLEAWRSDQAVLDPFLVALRSGHIAVAPPHNPSVHPIRILLGDFLGESGIIRFKDGTETHGIRVEIFSPSLSPPGFTESSTEGWFPPLGSAAPHSLRYRSEWVGAQTLDHVAQLVENGVNMTYMDWWDTVALASQTDTQLPNNARLPSNGVMYHFHPLEFMNWINDTTWKHEWHKYELTDPTGNPIPFIDANGNARRPRSRRI